MTGVLYHYTCRHQAPAIRAADKILPGIHIHGKNVGGARFAWFTDLQPPVPREAVGLTSQILDCDRTEIVFTVDRDTASIQRWIAVRRQHRDLWELECDGAMPVHWFVSETPVPVLQELSC